MSRLTRPPIARSGSPSWRVHSRTWPNGEHSQFWKSDGVIWHVQRFGAGPTVLMLHGAGSASHSWRSMANELKSDYEVLLVDLPGHGFTQSPSAFQPSLNNVSAALARLLALMQVDPSLIIGHSAGAALAVRMIDRQLIAPKTFVSINGAFRPFDGVMGLVAPLAAKVAAANRAVSWLISQRALESGRVAKLISDTGSNPEKTETKFYELLFQYPGQIRGTLQLMANWNLAGVTDACARISIPSLYISAENDQAVDANDSVQVAARSAYAKHLYMENLGHLAHEEEGVLIAKVLRDHELQASCRDARVNTDE